MTSWGNTTFWSDFKVIKPLTCTAEFAWVMNPGVTFPVLSSIGNKTSLLVALYPCCQVPQCIAPYQFSFFFLIFFFFFFRKRTEKRVVLITVETTNNPCDWFDCLQRSLIGLLNNSRPGEQEAFYRSLCHRQARIKLISSRYGRHTFLSVAGLRRRRREENKGTTALTSVSTLITLVHTTYFRDDECDGLRLTAVVGCCARWTSPPDCSFFQ